MAAECCALKFIIHSSRLLGLSNLSVWPSVQATEWEIFISSIFPFCIYISEQFLCAVSPVTGEGQ